MGRCFKSLLTCMYASKYKQAGQSIHHSKQMPHRTSAPQCLCIRQTYYHICYF